MLNSQRLPYGKPKYFEIGTNEELQQITVSIPSAISTRGLPDSSVVTGDCPMLEIIVFTAASVVCLVVVAILNR